ncbi:MAG: hypothetical protein IPQ15_16320 [Betaproteobacteria bacterium]|nr:hypothetical protein [Betaproteobacteria bacterium]
MNWEIEDMPRKEPGFAERLQTAVKAKTTQLERMRATALANEPHRHAAGCRVEAAEARKIRTAEQRHANRVTAELRDGTTRGREGRASLIVQEEKARKDAERATKWRPMPRSNRIRRLHATQVRQRKARQKSQRAGS